MTERDERLTFALLWAFVLFNYIYADIGMVFSIFIDPALLQRIQQGLGGSGAMTDAFFLGGAVLMEVSIATMLLSWLGSLRVARWANILAGILFTIVILFTLLGSGRVPPLNYYTFFQVIEIGATAYIAWRAWNWRPGATPESSASAMPARDSPG